MIFCNIFLYPVYYYFGFGNYHSHPQKEAQSIANIRCSLCLMFLLSALCLGYCSLLIMTVTAPSCGIASMRMG